MSKKVRVGLIGTSWWADWMLFPSLKSHPQADLVAICGRDQVRAAEMAGKYSVPQVFADYREMITNSGLDAVIVATPDDLHHEMTLAALNAGLHVLCEKPLAINAPQALEMAEQAQSAGVKHMVMYSWRWLPAVQYLHEMVGQGYVGRVYHGEFNFYIGLGRDPGYVWRIDGDRSNGALGDLGSHMIDSSRWLVGDIVSVSANLSTAVRHQDQDGAPVSPVNDSAHLLVEFAGGAQGVIQASYVTHNPEHGYQIKLYGEQGTLELNWGSEPQPILRGARSQDEKLLPVVLPETLAALAGNTDLMDIYNTQPVGVRLFIDSILADKPISPNFWDGYKNQLIIDAAIESNAKRAVIDITPMEIQNS